MKSILDESPNTILGLPISQTQQVVLCYLIPTIVSSIVYIVYTAADIVLTYEYIAEEEYHIALLTFVILCTPALGCFIFTVTSIELFPEESGCGVLKWFVLKVIQHVLFPVWAMYGYAERLFWSIESVRKEEDEREICLWNASKTRPIELYHFLQAYFQAIPQILVQTYIIIREDHLYRSDRVDVQILSIIMSLIRVSATTMAYQHFESQKLLGRRYPWSRKTGKFFHVGYEDMKNCYPHLSNNKDSDEVDHGEKHPMITQPLKTDENEHNSINNDYNDLPESDQHILYKSSKFRYIDNSSESGSDLTSKLSRNSSRVNEDYKIRKTICIDSSTPPPDYTSSSPPILLETNLEVEIHEIDTNIQELSKTQVKDEDNIGNMSTNDSDDEYLNNMESPDKKLKTKNIRTSDISSASDPPNYPAPIRPNLNVSDILQAEGNNNVTFDSTVIINTFSEVPDWALPERKFPQQGRSQDDILGKAVLFLAWICFISARTLTISIFYLFFPTPIICILIAHFLLMTAILIKHAKTRSMNRLVLYTFLGYVYIFCIIEFRIKFKRFYRSYILYFVLVYTENVILTAMWSLSAWESWWFSYLFYMIFLTSIINVLAMITYIKLLKPEKKVLYNVND